MFLLSFVRMQAAKKWYELDAIHNVKIRSARSLETYPNVEGSS